MINEDEKIIKTTEETKVKSESRKFQLYHVNPPKTAISGMSSSRRPVGNIRLACLWVWLISINQLGVLSKRLITPMPMLQVDVPGGTEKGCYL
jgi:hypothetical protein